MSKITKKSGTYWKSLNDLAQNEAYIKYADNEFAEGAEQAPSATSRRNFLQIMGASVAMAGLAACRRPVEKIIPFVNQPENMVPGIPIYYATAMPFAGSGIGLLVETNEGRPVKVEGNPDHPSSMGATNRFHQGATLNMYDPDRSRNVLHNGEKSSYADFVTFCNEHFSVARKVAFITEDYASPSFQRLKAESNRRFEQIVWVTYEPVNQENIHQGNEKAFNVKSRTVLSVDRAKVIVSLGDDILDSPFNGLKYARDFAKARAVDNKETPARLYVAEANYSITGSMADHRFRVKNSDMTNLLLAIASKLSGLNGLSQFASAQTSFTNEAWVNAVANDLMSNKGASLLTLGAQYSADAHAVVTAINIALENSGKTVTYVKTPFLNENRGAKALAGLVKEIRKGNFDTVVILGSNPVYTAPKSLELEAALRDVTTIQVSNFVDETTAVSSWHINEASFLESWGDVYSYTGDMSIIQPMIQPLFDGKSPLEVANLIVTGNDEKGSDIVKKSWAGVFRSNFDKNWQQVLHDGIYPNTFEVLSPTIRSFRSSLTVSKPFEFEISFINDSKVHDGRFANNGWLQELPDPMTKITWDNVGMVSLKTAEKLGVFSQINKTGEGEADLVEIKTDAGTLEIPIWVVPGHADDSITISLGYGRNNIGRIADGVGFNAYNLISEDAPNFAQVKLYTKVGKRYPIACTQDHHSMEGRPLVREADITEYRANPTFAPDAVKVPGDKLDGKGKSWANPETNETPLNLFTALDFPDYQPQWGMTIDLNSCIGCGVCTIACQSENNIPLVGKDEVRRGREISWIRTDRYFNGDFENPQVVHQPMACQHCEAAPCEQVCPVAATVHSDDGLNQMTYNRCVGTRYCANNCPFKVRRFNFFNYPKEFLTTGNDPEIIQMAMNPEVTVRFRGVMEKCTFCVQRINRAKIDIKNKTGISEKPLDGTVKTACQQACPTNAIQFGDLTDAKSVVVQEKRKDRNYLLLEELNIRPRTSYLAKIRNYNNDLA